MTKPKIDLDSTEPVTFVWPVKIPTPLGEVEFAFTFRARTRVELAELGEQRMERARQAWEAAKAAQSGDDDDPFAAVGELRRRVIAETENDVGTILDIAAGWDLEHPFDAEHITKLCDRYHAAAGAIGTAYREALAKGRLGN